ncbi:MAG: preprotein translocase subunit TatB [Clostridiaceae bacterium]|jgi:TusA-related sulfurtransferase|nr:preprotein translocase subunit TatB [Clostridiaceae bacterium]
MKTIDARGLSCPEPVLLVKRAVLEDEFPFTVLIDDETPRQNIIRYASNNGHEIQLTEQHGEYEIVFTK